MSWVVVTVNEQHNNLTAVKWGHETFVGESTVFRQIMKDIRLLQSAAATSVLITGESGTGKELVARAIHFGSSRADKPFVPVNCSAIPSELAESILFGHEKGAFTGATADHKGLFETAHEGTLFLDEVGDMPRPIQAKLLRILEDGVVASVGSTHRQRVNVRVIAASNTDLNSAIASGSFRSDLFFRLAAFPFVIPPLRERVEDIPLLARHFFRTLSADMGLSCTIRRCPNAASCALRSFDTSAGAACPALSGEALAALQRYDYPGNVRELKNIIERALIESAGMEITPNHLHFQGRGGSEESVQRTSTPLHLPENLRQAEVMLAGEAVARAKGNIAVAARALGISRSKLYRLIPVRCAGEACENN